MQTPEITLRALLLHAELTAEQFARRLNQYAAEQGFHIRLDPKTPYKWLKGTEPRKPWGALAAALLSELANTAVSPADLGWSAGPQWIVWLPADTGLGQPWTGQGTLATLSEIIGSGVMERRKFLNITGNALTAPALGWLLAAQAADIASTRGYRLHESHADSIDAMTAQLRLMDDKLGGGAVLGLIDPHLDFVRGLLRNHSYTSAVGARLHASAAELLRLAGWLSYDAGHQARAQRYWVGALHAAHSAGDRAIGANVLAFMANQAGTLGLGQEAVRLAEAARQGYPGSSPRVTALLHLRAADAYSQVGDAHACRAAIDAGYSRLHDADPAGAGAPEWLYWLDEAQASQHIGSCYMQLGEWGQAQGYLRNAIKKQADPDTRESALRHANLAISYAGQRDYDRACATGTRAVDLLSDQVDSSRCVGRIRTVQSMMRRSSRSPVVASFNEKLNTAFGVPA